MPDITLLITLLAVFVCVALLTGSLTYAGLERSSPVRQRLRGIRPGAGSPGEAGGSLTTGDDPVPEVLRKVQTFIPRSPSEMGRLRRRLARAGFHRASHAAWYLLAQVAGAAVGFLFVVTVFGWDTWVVGVFGAIAGFLLPSFVVERRIKLRQKRIRNGLPDALDLLIVCLEAGLSLDQAILKCAEELRAPHPDLSEELRFVNVESRAGKPRLEALKNFAKRTQVDDVRALVAMLVQTDRFGTSVAQALRTHADESRTKRRQRAEEAAAKIGVKMVFPLVFCLFPAFFVVMIGPAVIRLIEFFGNSGITNIGGN